jgi:hypothetical protein
MKQELEVETLLETAPYDELAESMSDLRFWIRVFIRPCCKKPNSRMAKIKVRALKETLSRRTDLSEAQMQHVIELADQGEAWYLGRFCCREAF